MIRCHGRHPRMVHVLRPRSRARIQIRVGLRSCRARLRRWGWRGVQKGVPVGHWRGGRVGEGGGVHLAGAQKQRGFESVLQAATLATVKCKKLGKHQHWHWRWYAQAKARCDGRCIVVELSKRDRENDTSILSRQRM